MAYDPRNHWRRLIGASLAVLAAAFVVPRFVKAPDLDEQRLLAERPAWPTDLASARKFRGEVDRYVADHFPPRAQLIGALNYLRMKVGVSGSKKVIVGRDGWLFYDNDSHLGLARNDPPMTRDQQLDWLSGLAGRSEALAARGATYLFVCAPDKETIYPQYGPGWFRLAPDRSAVTLQALADRAQAGQMLYLHDPIARQAHWGVKTYSRHDTHWTGLGAYAGYAAIMRRLEALGRTEGPRPLEAFTEVRAGDPNKARNLALMLGVASFVPIDYPELEDPAQQAALKVTWLSDRVDWTAPRVVDTGQDGKPVLLMTMDSFSNALLPFLYGHFSRLVLAHNQDGAWREDLIERFNPDVVMLEVTEAGCPMLATPAPPASEAARQRIEGVLAAPPPPPPKPAPVSAPAPPRVVKTLEGGDGPDDMTGTDADERMIGRRGDDHMRGLGGDDLMRGGQGADVVDGGDGNDWVSGDRGDDTLTGGRGADVFHSFAEADLDLVTDFSIAEGDRVELDPGTTYTVRQVGADTVVEMSAARVVLAGVRAADLPTGWISVKAGPR